MKTKAKIDTAGRVVIPKDLREQYGLEPGEPVQFVPSQDGVMIVLARSERRFVRIGPVLAIDTGEGPAPASAFDPDRLRDERLGEQAGADRG